jgi:hypothetical protein
VTRETTTSATRNAFSADECPQRVWVGKISRDRTSPRFSGSSICISRDAGSRINQRTTPSKNDHPPRTWTQPEEASFELTPSLSTNRSRQLRQPTAGRIKFALSPLATPWTVRKNGTFNIQAIDARSRVRGHPRPRALPVCLLYLSRRKRNFNDGSRDATRRKA